MASREAEQLASRLRDMRTSHGLTQAVLAQVLSDDARVAVPTVSSWESQTTPKLPPVGRLKTYALFFSQQRIDVNAGLPREGDLKAADRDRFHALHRELLALRDAVVNRSSSVGGSSTWQFERGPIRIICSEAPANERSPLAKEGNPNHTRMFRYADLDALIELWGHIRASNPALENVAHRLAAEVVADDLSGDVVVLGGIAWNPVASELQKRVLGELPVQQVKVPDLQNGEIFRTEGPGGRDFRPQWEERQYSAQEPMDPEQIEAEQVEDAWHDGKYRELVEDVALLARLPNPFYHRRTITICSGVYSRGVLGAVRTLTDRRVRKRNETYIANRFPGGSFALLMRVPVVNGEAISPDLENPINRLYEWSPDEEAEG